MVSCVVSIEIHDGTLLIGRLFKLVAKQQKNSQGEWIDPRLHQKKKGIGFFRGLIYYPKETFKFTLEMIIGGSIVGIQALAGLLMRIALVLLGAVALWWVCVTVWYWLRANYIG